MQYALNYSGIVQGFCPLNYSISWWIPSQYFLHFGCIVRCFISFCLFLSLFGVLFWFRVMFLVSHRNNLEWNIFQKCQRITYFLHQWNELGVHTLYLSQEKNNKHFQKALSHYGSWYVFLCIEYKQIRNHARINPKNVNNLRCKNAKALSRGTTPKEILVLKKLV